MASASTERELPRLWRFGQVALDERAGKVRLAGMEVALDQSGYNLLLALLRHAGEVVTKEELLGAGWPGRVVGENTLSKSISRLRAALGEDGQAIGAVYSYGYRLSAPTQVERLNIAATPAPPPAPAQPGIGEDIPLRPGWKIVERLGGTTFLARAADGQARVFKFANDELGLRGLRREVALNHYLAVGEHDGEGRGLASRAVMPLLGCNLDATPYFIELPYCAEGNLRQWAERDGQLKSLAPEARVALGAQLCETIAALHAAGIIHRDLKPDNLHPQRDAQGEWRLMLGDLGMSEASLTPQLAPAELARDPAPDAMESVARNGSPLYTAPELLAGELATPASDVFALGVLLYQLLAGDLRRPLTPGWEADIDDPLLREDIVLATARIEQRTLGAAELARRLRTLDARRAAAAAAQAELEAQRKRDAQLQGQKQRLRWMAALSVGLALGLLLAVDMYLRMKAAYGSADRHRRRAEAVQTFLTEDVIRSANPYAGAARDTRVYDAIVRAADKVDVRFADQPDAALAVYARIIDVYASWGEYDRAKQLLQRAQVDADKLGSPLATARLQLQRCKLLRLSGDYDQADAACAAAQTGFDKLDRHSDATTTAIGGLMYERGDCAKAVATLAPVIARATPDDHDDVLADALWSSALCLPKLARFDEADATFKRLVAVQTRAHGANDPLVGWALADYGQFLTDTGRYAQSETMLLQAQKLLMAGIGAEHPDALVPGYSLAALANERGQWQTAIDLLAPRAQSFRQALGPRHLWTLYAQTELAYAQAETGNNAAAAAQLDAVRPVALDVLAEHPAKQAAFRFRWLRTEIALGRAAQAREEANALQAILQANFPANHPWHKQADCLQATLARPIADARAAARSCPNPLAG